MLKMREVQESTNKVTFADASHQATRLVPEEPLPAYTYVPGQTPRPNLPHEEVAPLAVERWFESRPYLIGLDRFNFGFYWEAHEVWESLWHSAGRRGPLADLLKGLIKLAAAGVKAREGIPRGVLSHANRAAELFRQVSTILGPQVLGLSLGNLVTLAEQIAQQGWPGTGETAPVLDPQRTQSSEFPEPCEPTA